MAICIYYLVIEVAMKLVTWLLLAVALVAGLAEGIRIPWLERMQSLVRSGRHTAGLVADRSEDETSGMLAVDKKTGKRTTTTTAALQQQQNEKHEFETFMDLVQPTGYLAEEHIVTTEDGYILTLHRIAGGPTSPPSSGTRKKPAVLLAHGLLAASDVWVLRGPGQDVSYMLVDAGYDVWLLNTRGNYYSKRHKKIAVKEEKFWRFSWHEFGIYDIAACIDHVLTTTGERRVSLIGHSMGATAGLALLAARPDYNDKVTAMLFFAPVAICVEPVPGAIPTIMFRYGNQLQVRKKMLKALGVQEVFPRSSVLPKVYSTMCLMPRLEGLCQRISLEVSGLLRSKDYDPMSSDLVQKFLRHYPQGTSLDTFLHFQQILQSGKFRPFDFGPASNFIRYNNHTPPEYSLKAITAPIVNYYGLNDAYATKESVGILHNQLPNSELREIPYERFTHLDFIVSNYTKELLYDDVIATLNRHRRDRGGEPTPGVASAAAAAAGTSGSVSGSVGSIIGRNSINIDAVSASDLVEAGSVSSGNSSYFDAASGSAIGEISSSSSSSSSSSIGGGYSDNGSSLGGSSTTSTTTESLPLGQAIQLAKQSPTTVIV